MNQKGDCFNNFKEGTILIFKKWSAFRISLDNNPHVLSEYSDENETQLEIDQMLNMLYEDMYNEMKKESGPVLEMNIADMLFYFIQEFFEVEIQDQDEFFVAKSLINLYNEVKDNKFDFLEKLRRIDKKFNFSNYSIEFPIDMIKVKLVDDFDGMNVCENENRNCENSSNTITKSQDDVEMSNTQNQYNKINNKNHTNQPDEDGFILVKKGKKN